MRWWLTACLCASLLFFVGGCGSHSQHGGEDLAAPGGDDLAVNLDGGLDLAPWGIDTRPSNATCLAPARPVSATNKDIGLQPMFPNMTFNSPMAIYRNRLSPTDPMRWFVVERGGTVWTFVDPNAQMTAGGVEQARKFLQISVDAGGEGGLLSIAFDPEFPTNHIVYASYTGVSPVAGCTKRASDWDCSQIARYVVTQNGDGTFSQGTEQPIFQMGQPYSNHDGGDMWFGPDGYLYVGFGDGGSGGDPHCNGQNLKSTLGKFLRIDPRSVASGYAIPPDNPFASPSPSPCNQYNIDVVRTQNCPEIFAWGVRNPYRWSFDSVPPNGAAPGLWVGDVGQDQVEEADFIEKGKNYGWNRKEATNDYSQACTPADTNYVPPLVEYNHGGVSRAIIGGFVYRGTAIPALAGAYVFGDYGTGQIQAIPDAYAISQTIMNPTPIYTVSNTSLVGFGEDEDHELYVITFGGQGQSIFKIVPATPPMQESTFPQKLSQTGCVDPNDPSQPAPGLIPYDVSAPLWSDGATKRRWMALPDGAQIHVGDDGHFQLPVGAVLMKEFSLNGQRLETRLLVHHDDGDWAGYTYVWDDNGQDATLIDGRVQKMVGAQVWTFPSRADCLACHTTAAGRSLGPDTRQLNRAMTYPDGRVANELDTLEHLGLFDAPLVRMPAFDEVGGTPETRAKAYLHSNCSHCHRPGSTASTQAVADFRYEVPFAQMDLCNVDPEQGSLGITGAKLLVPGDTSKSLISVRMHATDEFRMPKIGSAVVDPNGTALVDDWIKSISACP